MYLCISTVVDFNSQNFDPPLMKFDKYSPARDDSIYRASIASRGENSLRFRSFVHTMIFSLCFGFSFYRAMLCIRGTSHGPVSVCVSLCLSKVGVLLKG